MMPHDFMTMHSAKAVEYAIALGFLALFVLFWHYVNGGTRIALQAEGAAAPALAPASGSWFGIPDDVHLHPGHAWLREEPDGLVTVGMNSFAERLIGPVSSVALPAPGDELLQGGRAWKLTVDSVPIEMLSPVDGTVVECNDWATAAPERIASDPYGDGWLIKVRPSRLGPNLKQLISGDAARQWIDQAADRLVTLSSPDLGVVYQDGGVPVAGLARAVSGDDGWQEFARRLLLTD
jgi:glycine cleavage system H protein